MTDYSSFSPTLAGWVQQVWKDRADIKRAALTHAANKVADGVQRNDARAPFRFQEFRDIEGAGQIYDRYNDPGRASVTSKAWNYFLRECQDIADYYALNLAPQGGKWETDTFYHFDPKAGRGAIDFRVYAHLRTQTWYHGPALANHIAWMMGSIPGIQKFKISGPGFTSSRGDGLVVYLTDETSTQALLKDLQSSQSAHFSGDLSPAVKKIADGLGWAKEPPSPTKDHPLKDHPESQYSFGSYLAALIYVALKNTYFASISTSEDQFVARLRTVFDLGNVDTNNPHKPCATREEYEALCKTANAALVRQNAQSAPPQGTVGRDHTMPLGGGGT